MKTTILLASAAVLLATISFTPVNATCKLSGTLLQEIPIPEGVSHVKSDVYKRIQESKYSTFYTTTSMEKGVYRISIPDEEDRHVEISPGVWAEVDFGCYLRYTYDILVWNGNFGEMCSEENFNPYSSSCE